MKIKQPPPVTLKLGDAVVEYSLADMVRHFVRTGSEFNRTEDGARAGKRILDAFDGAKAGVVELSKEDHATLREYTRQPSRGYGRHEFKQVVRAPGTTPDGKTLIKELKRYGQAPAMDYLPLIDAIANAEA